MTLLNFAGLARKLLDIKLSNPTNKQKEYKKALFYTLKDLGGVYIKFLQIICVNHNFTAGWITPKELSVFENVNLEHIDLSVIIDPRINIENTPFAAGSFAQVYRGYLPDGNKVAIKVLRPSVIKRLDRDLVVIRRVARLANRFLPKTLLNFKDIASEFCITAKAETDYEAEIANTNYFYNYFKDNENVVIPKVYTEFSNKNAIVQDYIEGPTFGEILELRSADLPASKIALDKTGSNLWQQLTIAGQELLKMVCLADFTFGDPHPGNIKLLPDNKIAFIDFGIVVGKVSNRMAFYNFMKEYLRIYQGYPKIDSLLEASINCFCPNIASTLTYCQIGQKSALETISNAVNEKMNAMRSNSRASKLIDRGHIFKLFYSVLDNSNALNIQIDPRQFMLIKACQVFLSSVNLLSSQEGKANYIYCVYHAINGAATAVDENGIDDEPAIKSHYSPAENYEILLDIFSSLAAKDEVLFRSVMG